MNNLRALEALNYPEENFEILYINDSSTDDSVEILKKNITNKNIKILNVPDDFSPNAHKKRAIRFGISNSKGKIIITTDADCFFDPGWLQTMMNYMNEDTGFVSGPVEFNDSNDLFGNLQKLEFAGLVITGAGLIGSGSPTICNAANIAYRREAFDEVNGFNDQLNLSSGDDEILMQKIDRETKYRTCFCPDKKAIVKTAANVSIHKFYQQRKRWASKGLFYADKLLIIKLILIFNFYLSLPILFVLGILISPIFLILLIINFFLKIISEYLVLKKGSELLFNNNILKPFLLAELLHVPYIIISGISGIFGNFTWKERKVKR